MNNKTDIVVGGRRLTVEFEELGQLQVVALAERVSEKLADIQLQNPKIADTSKLAILTALTLAAELDKEKDGVENRRRVLEHKLDQLTQTLKASLLAAGFQEP